MRSVKFPSFFPSILSHGSVSSTTLFQPRPLEPPLNFLSESLFQKYFLLHLQPPRCFLQTFTALFFAVFLQPCFCFLFRPKSHFVSIEQNSFSLRSVTIHQSIAINMAHNCRRKIMKIVNPINFSRSFQWCELFYREIMFSLPKQAIFSKR